jgi:two-component system LytT family response regulator
MNIKLLSSLIKSYCPDLDIVSTATNVEDGIKKIINDKPQLLFLDIEIHDKTAFDILKVIDNKEIQIIFITAYEKYAIQSFKYSIVDYILKPVKIESLIDAVNRCKLRIEEFKQVVVPKQTSNSQVEFLTVHQKEHIEVLRLEDIIHLQALGNYTEICTTERKKIISSRSLKENEEHLPDSIFLRVHNSHIINISFIEKVVKNKNGSIKLKTGEEIPISTARKKDVYDRLHL